MKKITNYLVLFLISLSLHASNLVMIDPAGDPGRKLVEGYERGVTLSMADYLKKALHDRYGCKVVLTRHAGEVSLPFQNASLANRMNVDFFLSLHVYFHEQPKPVVTLYHLLYHPLIDQASRVHNPLDFIPIYQAHFGKSLASELLCKRIKDVLNTEPHAKQLSCNGVIGLPFRPLCGICAPALACEVGISYEDQWRAIIDSLVEGLGFLEQPLA